MPFGRIVGLLGLVYQDTRSAIHNFRDRFPKQIHSAEKGEIFLDPPDDPFEKYGLEQKLLDYGKYSRKRAIQIWDDSQSCVMGVIVF